MYLGMFITQAAGKQLLTDKLLRGGREIDPVVQVLFQQKQELATLQHAVVSWLNKQIV